MLVAVNDTALVLACSDRVWDAETRCNRFFSALDDQQFKSSWFQSLSIALLHDMGLRCSVYCCMRIFLKRRTNMT
jgi:hypothetical protein